MRCYRHLIQRIFCYSPSFLHLILRQRPSIDSTNPKAVHYRHKYSAITFTQAHCVVKSVQYIFLTWLLITTSGCASNKESPWWHAIVLQSEQSVNVKGDLWIDSVYFRVLDLPSPDYIRLDRVFYRSTHENILVSEAVYVPNQHISFINRDLGLTDSSDIAVNKETIIQRDEQIRRVLMNPEDAIAQARATFNPIELENNIIWGVFLTATQDIEDRYSVPVVWIVHYRSNLNKSSGSKVIIDAITGNMINTE